MNPFRLAIPLCVFVAAAAATTPCAAQSDSDSEPAARLIEQRMERIFADRSEPAADARSPASPTEPADPAAPAASAEGDAGARSLPAPSGAAEGGITRRLTDAAAADAAAGRRPLPGGGERDGGGNWVMSTLAALGVVIGLVLAIRWAYTRLTGRTASLSGSRAVEALSRTAIAPRNHVVLLRVGRRVLVCNDSAQGMRTLAEVDDPDEVAELLESVAVGRPDSSTGSFNGLLSKFSSATSERSVTTRDTLDLDDDLPLPDEGRDPQRTRDRPHARPALAAVGARPPRRRGGGGERGWPMSRSLRSSRDRTPPRGAASEASPPRWGGAGWAGWMLWCVALLSPLLLASPSAAQSEREGFEQRNERAGDGTVQREGLSLSNPISVLDGAARACR